MSQITPSERIQLLVAGYVLGNLSSDEAAELTRLIEENPSLLEDVADLQDASEFAQDITEVTPPPTLRSRVLESSQRPTKPQRLSAPTSLRNRRFSWPLVGNAIAAVLVVALGVNNYRLRQDLTAERANSSQLNVGNAELLTYSLASPEPTDPGTASIVINPTTLEAELTAQKLIPLPADKVYAVWTLPEQTVPVTTNDNGAILADVFRVNAQGDVGTKLTIPAVHRRPGAVAKMAITVEDAASPQLQNGAIVLVSE